MGSTRVGQSSNFTPLFTGTRKSLMLIFISLYPANKKILPANQESSKLKMNLPERQVLYLAGSVKNRRALNLMVPGYN
jgi:hypothetical protein